MTFLGTCVNSLFTNEHFSLIMSTNIKTGIHVDARLKARFQELSAQGGDRFLRVNVNSGMCKFLAFLFSSYL
jgi:hypothetical protein